MLHNLGRSGGIRNDRENRSFCEVVYMFRISSAKWCICDIHHLRQHRENGATSVYIIIYSASCNIYIYIYIYIHIYIYIYIYVCTLRKRLTQCVFKAEHTSITFVVYEWQVHMNSYSSSFGRITLGSGKSWHDSFSCKLV